MAGTVFSHWLYLSRGRRIEVRRVRRFRTEKLTGLEAFIRDAEAWTGATRFERAEDWFGPAKNERAADWGGLGGTLSLFMENHSTAGASARDNAAACQTKREAV